MRTLGPALVALLFLPLLWLPMAWLMPASAEVVAMWQHVANTVLIEDARNSLMLALGVAIVAGVGGVSCAWLVVAYRFPLRAFMNVALLLPLAVPAYISAVAVVALTPFRGMLPAVFLLGFATMPYVYLAARIAFVSQPKEWREAAMSLGLSPRRYFYRVALPAARPFWAMGIMLAVMEAVADIGAVSMLGVPTLATGVLRSWFYLGEPVVAARMAFVLMALVILVIALERFERAQRRFITHARADRAITRLGGARAWAATLWCAVPVACGGLLPVAYLAWLNAHNIRAVEWLRVLGYAGDSLMVAGAVALVAVMVATFLHVLERFYGGMQRVAHLLAYAGYAVPGVAVAVGMLLLDGAVPQVLLTGTFAGLVLACVIRFLATAMGQVHSGFERIPRELDMAAQSLGANKWRVFSRVQAPLLALPMLAAALVVMVDGLKELPATLILRPFDVKPLAVVVYEFASDDRAVEAAPYALALIGLCALCMLALSRISRQMERRYV